MAGHTILVLHRTRHPRGSGQTNPRDPALIQRSWCQKPFPFHTGSDSLLENTQEHLFLTSIYSRGRCQNSRVPVPYPTTMGQSLGQSQTRPSPPARARVQQVLPTTGHKGS